MGSRVFPRRRPEIRGAAAGKPGGRITLAEEASPLSANVTPRRTVGHSLYTKKAEQPRTRSRSARHPPRYRVTVQAKLRVYDVRFAKSVTVT